MGRGMNARFCGGAGPAAAALTPEKKASEMTTGAKRSMVERRNVGQRVKRFVGPESEIVLESRRKCKSF